jgi:tetratricopeptide (TPR) repeat protein
LGGYWPLSYRHRRYYWYGYHPYTWYGYYPIAREVQGDTHNQSTYNYYTDDNVGVSVSGDAVDGIVPVDHNTFADVREKLAQQATEEPGEVTLADRYFEDAVKAFEVNNYEMAIEKFGEAMALAPDDMILPFAYSQALFARGQYSEAASVLRHTLANVTPEKEGIFYPRGLYSDDDVLFEQINLLAERAELYSFDADLQLLLGYHLFGIGELEEAVVPLQNASLDMNNAVAATTILNMLEKIRAENVTVESVK